MIQPLLNATDNEWVMMVGKYITNMGCVEAATRQLIFLVDGTDKSPAMTDDLLSRLGYLRRRFPRHSKDRHSWAMNVFGVGRKHVGFRNIVAHSPIVIAGDGSHRFQAILNITPNDLHKAGELVGLEELRGRVNESAILGRDLLQMQEDFHRHYRPGQP